MSGSEYFIYNNLTRGALARASDVNSRFQQVETGLALLPSSAGLREGRLNFFTAGGTPNALTAALSPALTAYNQGLSLGLLIASNNTGAATLNLNGLGAIPIRRSDRSALASGDLVAGQVYPLVYDGTYFILMRATSVELSGYVAASAASASAAAGSAGAAAGSASAASASAGQAASSAADAAASAAAAANSAASVTGTGLAHLANAETFTGSKTFNSPILASAGVTINGQSITALTAAGRTLIESANASSQLTLLGVSTFIKTLLDDVDAPTARTTIGALASTTAASALAALTPAANKIPYFDSTNTATLFDSTTFTRNIMAQPDAPSIRSLLSLVPGTDVQAQDAELAALAGLVSAANKLPYFTGSGTAALADLTAFARTFLDDPDAATVRATIGAQALDAELTALAGLTSAANALPYFTGSGTAAVTTLSAFMRTLLDDADAATARATLGVGGGWSLLETHTAVTISNSVSLTTGAIPTCTDILVAIEDLDFSAATQNFIIAVGFTSGSLGSANLLTSVTSKYSGSIVIENAKVNRGSLRATLTPANFGSSPLLSVGASQQAGAWRCDGGINYIAFFTNNAAGATGTINIYTR